MKIEINGAFLSDDIKKTYEDLLTKAQSANESLEKKDREGSDYLGWTDLPTTMNHELLKKITACADRLRKDCDYVVSIGIGGSYLGAKAVIEALNNSFAAYKNDHKTKVLFAGNHISEDYLYELKAFLTGKKFGIINISKSGTTTEPAIAFRILKDLQENEWGKAFSKEHTVAITDAQKGALRTLADDEGYETFIIPDDVGGRFSVLTPVGLLPIAVAGFNVTELVRGAEEMESRTNTQTLADKNISVHYASIRNALYQHGKKIEILANYHPKLHYVGEWWKQLFGESEGKNQKGIFNAAVDLTTDLHSMGQWIQDGERIIFETVLSVEKPNNALNIPRDEKNLDGLNYIADKHIDEVNKQAEKGTILAHKDGNVPVIRIIIPTLNEYYLGQLFYFFERSVGISGYLLGVNPFNQPGVEAYKSNMFALLKKPGYEEASKKIAERLKEN